jgi:hypothetical protein
MSEIEQTMEKERALRERRTQTVKDMLEEATRRARANPEQVVTVTMTPHAYRDLYRMDIGLSRVILLDSVDDQGHRHTWLQADGVGKYQIELVKNIYLWKIE